MRIGSLFSGAGGLDMAVAEVFGGDIAWHSEIDNRGLLSATAHRAVEFAEDDLGDRAGGPVLRAAGAVLGDLADLRMDAVWATVSAASVGAPHRRERVFIVATNASRNGFSWGSQRDFKSASGFAASQRDDVDRRVLAVGGGNGSTDAADPSNIGCEDRGQRSGVEQTLARVRGADVPLRGYANAADSSGNGRDKGRPEPAGQQRGFDAAVSGDAAGRVELLPTPTTLDDREKRTTHAGGNLTLQGALCGVNPVDAERLGLVGDAAGVALLPTPRSSDCFGAGQHGEGGLDLRTTMALLCTPSASDGVAGGKTSRSGARIDEPLLGGQVREMATAWGKYEAAIRRWEQVAGPAPAPTEPNRNGKPRLNPAFSSWMMGWPAGWVTDPNIGISRNDQLRIIGNGVCSQQAVAALRYLLAVTT